MDGDFRSVDDSYYWAARMPDGAPALLSVTEDWDNLFDEDVVQEGNRPYVVDAYVWSTDISWTGRETEGWLASGGGGYFTDCPSVRSIVYDLFGIDVLDESQARPVGPEWEGLLHAGESGDVGDVAYLNDSARFVRLCPGDAGGDASLPAGLARAIDRSAASREVEFFPSSYGMIPLVGDVSSTDVCDLYDSVSSEVLDEGPSIPIDGAGGGRDARRDPLSERSVTR